MDKASVRDVVRIRTILSAIRESRHSIWGQFGTMY